jgi:tRNA threonylcarbamoyladenosine biosynthesis protein TsaE
MTLAATTKSPDDTRELAAAVAGLARPRDTVLLAGDLGAGKTAFTQGFGRALGIEGPITSPTFTLVRHYTDGTIPLLHADVYRVERLQEIIDLGLPELIDEGAIALIEWGDVAAPALAPDFLEIRIEFGTDEEERRLRLRAVGSQWSARQGALSRALERWAS